jgi:hypothetical protein
VIPFIASNYRRDKIWLRRTKPSKREYQAGSLSASFSILIHGYQWQDLTGDKNWDAIDGGQRHGKTVIERPGHLAKDRAQLELTGLGTLGDPWGALLARCNLIFQIVVAIDNSRSMLRPRFCWLSRYILPQVLEFCGKCKYPAF